MSELEQTLSIFDIRRALARHRRKSLLFFSGSLLVVVLVALFWPRTYVSEAQMYVKLGRTSVRLDPTATTGETIALMESRETEINSILEVLRSRALAERVVEALGAGVVLGSAARQGDQVPATEQVLRSLNVSTPRRTNVITVTCQAASPRLAQQILATTLELFKDEHVRVNRTDGSFGFFDAETRRLAAGLEAAAARVRETKNAMGVITIEGQRSILQSQLDAIERETDAASVALAAGLARADALRATIERLPERVAAREERGHPNPAGDAMRNELYQLEIRERELLSKFTEQHPQVQALREQVGEARRILQQQPAERTQVAHDLNPTRQELQLRLLAEQADIDALQARHGSLQARRETVLARIQQLNRDEVQLRQLEREAELLEQNYRLNAEKLAQARTDQQLDQQRISNVNVFQPPTYIAKPASPRLGMLAALGLMLGGLGAVGVAIVAETIDRSLRTADEVEQQVELPVLVSVPRVHPQQVFLNSSIRFAHDSSN
ncbi:MAG: hypothetical protein J5I93_12995 [Pirellulaceae bacterium]|nr:hypothetical protein [Pirellulaceae bacterium]